VNRARLEIAGDKYLDAGAGGIEANRILHVHGNLFVG